MSRVREDLIRKLVRELVRQELDEANSTASVGGSYNTPHAFAGSNKKGKKKGKAGYTGGHEDPTIGTTNFNADDPKLFSLIDVGYKKSIRTISKPLLDSRCHNSCGWNQQQTQNDRQKSFNNIHYTINNI